MILLFQLDESTKRLISQEADETIKYCVPYDISESGEFQKCGYVIATDKRLIITEDDRLLCNYKYSELTKIKCEAQVNCGILIVNETGKDYERRLVRFSMKHLSRISFVARGAEILREGGTKQVESREYEKTCPKCGRALPGTRQCPKCDGKGVTLKKFWDLCKEYKLKICVVSFTAIFASLLELYIPQYQKTFVDNVLTGRNGDTSDVLRFVLIMGLLLVMTVIAFVVKNWWFVELGTRMSMDIRKKMYFKIQELSLSYIQDRRPGELMNRVMRDTNEIKNFMQECFGHMFSCIVQMIGAIAIMLVLDWKMTLISIVFMPLVAFISVAFRKIIKRKFHMQWVKSDKMNSALQDVISGIRVVKSFGKEKEESQHFKESADEFATVQRRNEVFWATFYPILTFIMSIGIYFVVYIGGRNVLGVTGTSMTLGTLMQFTSYAWMLYGPLGWMTHFPRMLSKMITSLERIYDVLDEQPRITNAKKAQKLDIKGEVEFKQACFGYKSYEPVLDKVDLKVKKGEMIGLVGASGTGKSTMINLIMRLYELDDGELLIDGVNINDLDIDYYHSQLGVVLQENFLFSGTILNNIRFSKPEATVEEVIMAAKMANAHDFICKTPDGYNTFVGEHGHNLSGGERQRLAIARAILNDPKLLILDEATSSLDTESEYLIQKALERLTNGRTTFAIAHRLSTLRGADRLAVIDGHHIAELGTHNELMEKKGIYYGLVTAQLEMQSLKKTGTDEETTGL